MYSNKFDLHNWSNYFTLVVQTKLYTEDWIGLKTLDEAGRVKYIKVPGNHLGISKPDMKKYVVPYLQEEEEEEEDETSKQEGDSVRLNQQSDQNSDQPQAIGSMVDGSSSYRWPSPVKNFFGEMLGVKVDQ